MYTSGTTGKPKGILHTTGGYLVGTSYTHWAVFDLKPDDDVFWTAADIGWVTGHSYIVYGPLANGATSVMYEGTPDTPHKGRWWEIIEKYKVTILYCAPTAIRTFMKWGEEIPEKFDLSSLRLLGSVGEPINPEAYIWYRETSAAAAARWSTPGGRPRPARIMISPLPGVTAGKPGSAMKALPGISADVVDDEGNPVTNGAGGYLVLTEPWPAMLRTIWGDDERYKDTYWSRFEDMYFAGDGAKLDEDGDIWLLGRVDDVMNVSGHRLSTTEIESALVSHPKVAEAAVVGANDDDTGQAVVRVRDPARVAPATAATDIVEELRDHVAKEIGKIARPRQIMVVPGAAEDPLRQDHAAAAARRRREPRGRRRHHARRLDGDGPDLREPQGTAPTTTERRRPGGSRATGTLQGTKEAHRRQRTPAPSPRPPAVPSKDDPTIGRLVADASRDVSTLVRNEIELAKSELKISVKAGGSGLGLFARAAFLALLAIIMLSVAIAYFIHMTGLALAWCFLIVFVLYLLIAGLLGFIGLRKVKQVRAPERAIHQAQEIKNILRSAGVTRPRPHPSRPSRYRAPGSTGTSPPTGPGSMSPRRDRLTARWCCCCTASRSSGGPGATAAGARRGRLPGRRDGPARLRRLGQDPQRLRPVTLAQDVSGVVKALGGGTRSWSATAGAGTSAGRPPRCTRARSSALCAVSAPHPLTMLHSLRPGRGPPWRPAARARHAAADAARAPAGRPVLRLPARPPARVEATGPRPRDDTWRRTSGRSACGRPRTARWSTTAGCSAPGCAPTGGASPR